MLYIGIDLGTSAIKLLMMDEQGTIRKIVSREYPIYFPNPGWSEQNPEDWFDASMDGLKELVEWSGDEQIGGISFGGQMHGLVILDEEDCVIRPAILWNDGRTGEETDYLNQVIGKETLSACTANIAFAGFTAPKLLWVKKNEPDNFKRISKIMLPKDYLAYRLTGVHTTDPSDASGMLLFDVKNRCWSDDMLRICGIRKEQMPKVMESYEIIGTLKSEIREKLGITYSVKVAAGAGDNAAAAVGTGTVGEGKCNLSLGTSGTIFISSRTFQVDSHNALHAFAHADGYYHLMGCMLSAASCNKWWMDGILETKEYQKEQDKIKKLGENQVYFLPYLMGERSPHNDPSCNKWWMDGILETKEYQKEQDKIKKLGENQVYFLPYLMGERSPHNDPAARGTFIGMTMDTTREEMTQAVLEGVAFALRDSLEVARSLGVKVTSSKICGGGAKSSLWKQMMANILNVRLDIVACEEGPSYGGAILAAVGCGEYASVEEASEKIVKVIDTVEPEECLIKKYEEKYQKFRQIYPKVKELFPIIAG